jgi:hypothetical protein
LLKAVKRLGKLARSDVVQGAKMGCNSSKGTETTDGTAAPTDKPESEDVPDSGADNEGGATDAAADDAPES